MRVDRSRTLASVAGGILIGWWLSCALLAPAPSKIVWTTSVQPDKQGDLFPRQPTAPAASSLPLLAITSSLQQRKAIPRPVSGEPTPDSRVSLSIPGDHFTFPLNRDHGLAPSALPLPVDRTPVLPTCLWAELETLCRARFLKKSKKWVNIRAEWVQGAIHCNGDNGRSFGRFKRSNVELEVTLMRGCVPDVLNEMPPPIGTSTLPLDALERSLRLRRNPFEAPYRGPRDFASVAPAVEKIRVDVEAVPESADLLRLRALLFHGNETLSILALGASVTFMFADLCVESDSYLCNTGPHETLRAFDSRIDHLRTRRKKWKGGEQADWLVQLVRIIKHGAPQVNVAARSVAYGGMNPKAVAACVADFVAAPPSNGRSSASSRPANLIILDFAIFGGLNPFSEDWHAIEALVRSLYVLRVAVILINMPTWCYGASGERVHAVHGHSKCQRMIFDRRLSRLSVAAATLPDRYDDQLSRVAGHYGQTAVSVLNALQPLVADGSIDLLDFTHDGKHPIMYPRGTQRGSVLSRYMADLLANAIDPTLLNHTRSSIWRGGAPPGRPQGANHSSNDATLATAMKLRHQKQWRVLPPATPLEHPPGQLLPASLAPGLTSSLRGVRCYGWGARATRGSWQSIMRLERGWKLTRDELAYDETSKQWQPLAVKRVKPGLTSVVPGDVVSLQIDTTLDRRQNAVPTTAEQPLVQLTYLQSYEQVGLLQVNCEHGCTCGQLRIQALEPTRLATLNTKLLPVSESSECTLRLTNVSPRKCGTARGPCTKIKLVALAIAAPTAR